MSTQSEILDVAESLAQSVGYSAFSYRDLAEKVGIKTASIHYHFPTKADLCLAMIARHRERMQVAMAAVDASSRSARDKLARYVKLFQETINEGNRMCLCGMLASDLDSLPSSARDALRGAFDDHEAWLTKVLAEGRSAGDLEFAGSPSSSARLLLSSLEGALLVARTYADPKRFSATSRAILDSYRSPL